MGAPFAGRVHAAQLCKEGVISLSTGVLCAGLRAPRMWCECTLKRPLPRLPMPWLARWQWPFIAMLEALATSQTLHHSRLRP